MITAPLSLEHIIKPSSISEGKAPVLFMFHGYGSNEEDLYSFAPELPEELCIISVRAPYTLEPFGYAWYAINFDAVQGKWSDDSQAGESREKIITFIDESCKTYGLDEKRVTLLGFSQGTILSYAVALSYPEKIKSLDLLKVDRIQSRLIAIKGQYLLFDDNTVLNIRKHNGYVLEIET